MKFERVTTKTNTFVMYVPENNVQDANGFNLVTVRSKF